MSEEQIKRKDHLKNKFQRKEKKICENKFHRKDNLKTKVQRKEHMAWGTN